MINDGIKDGLEEKAALRLQPAERAGAIAAITGARPGGGRGAASAPATGVPAEGERFRGSAGAPKAETAERAGDRQDLGSQIRFAHLSDWHATTLVGGGAALLRPKRLSGWASWMLTRRHRHSETILDAAFRDVHAQAIDRVLVTGDLTHVSLEQEFRAARTQLERLGGPERVFLIPGNHDCYVSIESARSWDVWAPYLRGMARSELEASLARGLAPDPEVGRAPAHADYPTLRILDDLAVVGLCSAIPTPIFRAGGRLGIEQLERFDSLLAELGEQGLCRVVLIHHPVAASSEPTRRALWDAEALREVLVRRGAELVLHGHKHRRRVHWVPGPAGEIPVIGVPSSSEVGSRPEKRAQYHVYTIEREEQGGFRIEAEIRGYDEGTGAFRRVDERLF